MKKYEQLGKKLTREEQKAVGGGLTQFANIMCDCFPGGSPFPVCGPTCYDVYSQCDSYCSPQPVNSYGTCVFLGGCM